MKEEKPRRNWVFALAIILFLALIVGLAVYVFVIPMGRFEKLGMSSYYWVAVPEKGVRQLVLRLGNSGTYDLFIEDLLIDGMSVDSSSYGGNPGLEIQSTYGTWLYVAPANTAFIAGHMYNITMVTSRSNRFSFAVEVKENNTETESVQIAECLFYHSPLGSSQKVVGVTAKVLSHTDMIIKKIWVDNTACDVTRPVWLYYRDSERDIMAPFDWVNGRNCTVAIETVAGSRCEVNTTVHFP